MIYLKRYYTGFHQNEQKTLARKARVAGIVEKVPDSSAKTALAKYTYHPDLNLWDFGVRASKHVRPCDSVYILCDNTLYFGRVLDKISDRHGEIGDAVKWHRLHHEPWKNPVLLIDLVHLDGAAMAVRQFLHDKVELEQNFFRLKERF